MLSARGDESHDETKKRVFSVAGVIGREEEWDALEPTWRKRTNGKTFHATDCETDHGEYEGLNHKDNLKEYADLVKILCRRTKFMGYGVAVDLAAYHSIFPDLPEDQPYYLCFHNVVMYMCQLASLHIPPEIAEFTFHRNLEREYNATYLYDYLAKQPEWRFNPYIAEKVSFATQENVGIQVADLIARETMKHLDNKIGPVRRQKRESLKALEHTKRFEFHFYTKEVLFGLSREVKDLDLGTLRTSGDQLPFRGWLSELSQPDTVANRIKYIQYAKGAPTK